jgi:hypothetical protein
MTVLTSASSVTYGPVASTGPFTIPFPFLSTADLVVTLNGAVKLLGVDYTIAGTVVTAVNPMTGTLIIARATVRQQPISFPLAGTFDPTVLETALDRLELQIQDEVTSRAAADTTLQGSILSPFADVGLASFKTTGTSASRTLAARGASVFDVTDFGAVGDGTTDCSPAIQSAINAMVANGGGTVYFPRGKYRCATMGTTAGGSWACFQGYFTTPNTTPVAFIGEDGAEVWYDVTGRKGAVSSQLFALGSDYSASGYTIAQKIAQTRWYLQGLTIRGLTFRGWRGQNHTDIELSQANQMLYLDLTENVEITDCRFFDTVGGSCFYNLTRRFNFHHNQHRNVNAGVQGTCSQWVRISDNSFECPFKCDDQIGIFGTYAGSDADPYRSRNVVIQNNIIDKKFDGYKLQESGTNRGWGRGIISQGSDEVEIVGNVVVNNNSASALDHPANPTVVPSGGMGAIVLENYQNTTDRNILISNNVLRNCGWGIKVGGPTQNLRISNNLIEGMEFFAIQGGLNQVQTAAAGIGMVIEGNTINDCGRSTDPTAGLNCFAIRTYSLTNSAIRNNRVLRCKAPWIVDLQSETTGSVYFTQDGVTIADNEVICDPADTSVAFPNSGLVRTAFTENLRVLRNRLRGRWGIGVNLNNRGSITEVSDNWVEDHATISDTAGFDFTSVSTYAGHTGAVVISTGNWIRTYGNAWDGVRLKRSTPRGIGTPTSAGGWSAYEEAKMGPEFLQYNSGAIPTAIAAYRGLGIQVPGGAGVADYYMLGHKNAADTYEWRAILCQLAAGAQAVTGAKAGNAALTSLLTKLANLGIISDTTT